jgi:hypothetical protein
VQSARYPFGVHMRDVKSGFRVNICHSHTLRIMSGQPASSEHCKADLILSGGERHLERVENEEGWSPACGASSRNENNAVTSEAHDESAPGWTLMCEGSRVC